MKENNGVSVVIPSRNYGHYLAACLDSVLAQTFKPLEILVVDDGSTDDTPALVKRYGERVRYLRTEGRGAYGARNDSLDHVQGAFFLNVDADNLLHPQFIERSLEALQAAPPEVGYIYTQRKYFGDRSGQSSFPAFDREALILSNYVDMGSLIRMELVQTHRFDERFNRGQGDHAFFLKLLSEGIKGQRLDDALLEYRVHSASISQNFGRRHDQLPVCRLLIETFPELYSQELARKALADARNRTLVSLIQQRHPEAPFAQRLSDFLCFTRVQWRHAEWQRQLQYLLAPRSVC